MVGIDYYKSQWNNCVKCRIHYMSEAPHLKAYLCDECWNGLPHYKVDNLVSKKQMNKEKQTNNSKYTIGNILLYTVGNILCMVVIGYYLWFN